MTIHFRPLAGLLLLTLPACMSGSGGSAFDTDAGGPPANVFRLGDAVDTGAGGSAGEGVGVGQADAAVDVTDGALEAPDGGTDAASMRVDATVDAGTDTGGAPVDAALDAAPPPLSGTCEPCTVDADCLVTHLCKQRVVDSYAYSCIPRKPANGCVGLPGGDYLKPNTLGNDSVCTPSTDIGVITCAEWHTLTGL